MADIASAFEEHLRSLPDSDWDALVQRVRPSRPQQASLPGEHSAEPDANDFTNAGLAEAHRRGYIDADGKPVTR